MYGDEEVLINCNIFVCIVLLLSIGFYAFCLGYSKGTRSMEEEAVKAGVAYYNPTNKTFQFISKIP
jgi:hypothetical protein